MSNMDGSSPESSTGGKNIFKRFVRAKPVGIVDGQSPFVEPIKDAEIVPVGPKVKNGNSATQDSLQSSPLGFQSEHADSPVASSVHTDSSVWEAGTEDITQSLDNNSSPWDLFSAQTDSSVQAKGVDPEFSTWPANTATVDQQPEDLPGVGFGKWESGESTADLVDKKAAQEEFVGVIRAEASRREAQDKQSNLLTESAETSEVKIADADQDMSVEDVKWLRKLREVTKEGSPERADIDAELEGYTEHEPTYEDIEKVFLSAHTESWNTLSERLRAAGFDHGQQAMLRKGIIEATHKNKDKAEEITKALKDRMSQLTDENRELLSEHLDRQRHVKMTGGEYKGVKGTKRKVTTSDGKVVTIQETAPIDRLLDSLNDEWTILLNKTRSPEEDERLLHVSSTCKTLMQNHRAYIDRKFRVKDGDVRRAVNSDDVFAAVVEDDRLVWGERFPGADRMQSDIAADQRVTFRLELKMPKKPTTRKPSIKPIGTIGKPPEPPEPTIVTGPKPPAPTGSIDTGIGEPPKPPIEPQGHTEPSWPSWWQDDLTTAPKPPAAPPFVPAGAGILGKINFGQFDDDSYGEKGPGDEHMTEQELIMRREARKKGEEKQKKKGLLGWAGRHKILTGAAVVGSLLAGGGMIGHEVRQGNNSGNQGQRTEIVVGTPEVSEAAGTPTPTQTEVKVIVPSGETSTPTNTPTPTAIETETAIPTATSTSEPTETATVSPTATSESTSTATPEPTETPKIETTETIEATVPATETSEGEARTANEESIIEHVDQLMDDAQLVTVKDGSYISLEMQEDGIMPGGEFNLEVYQQPTELGGLILINYDTYVKAWQAALDKGEVIGEFPSPEMIVKWMDENNITELQKYANTAQQPGDVYIVFDNKDGKNFDDEFYNLGEFTKQIVYSGNFSIYQEEVEVRKQEMIKKLENDNKEKYAAVVAKNAINAADADGVLSTSKPK